MNEGIEEWRKWMKEWRNKGMKQMNEQWMNEGMNKGWWIHNEGMNEMWNEWMTEWMNGQMNE